MESRKLREHWDHVHAGKQSELQTWYESTPRVSLDLIARTGRDHTARIIDIGAGSSTLVDELLDRGYRHISVLDISATALARGRARLGERGTAVRWSEADVTKPWSDGPCDIWHDRAVFHFLTEPAQRASYIAALGRAVVPGGHVMIATFALDGPESCSGLPVVRYSDETLAATLGAGYRLLESARHEHRTPKGAVQPFCYCLFEKSR